MLNGLIEFIRGIVDGASPPSERVKDGQRSVLLVREGYRPVEVMAQDEKRDHQIGDLPSLLQYMQRHGSPEGSTLFCDAARFVGLLEDSDHRHGLGQVSYSPQLTEAAKAWRAIDGAKLPHFKLKEIIEDRASDLVGKQLLEAVLKFSVRSEVAYDADLESGDSVIFKVSTKQGGAKGQAQLPKTFEVSIEPFRGWSRAYTFSFRIGFEFDADKRPIFMTSSRNWVEVIDEAIEDMIEEAASALGAEWLVVRGAPQIADLAMKANCVR